MDYRYNLAQVAQVESSQFDPQGAAETLLPYAIALLIGTVVVALVVAYAKYRYRRAKRPPEPPPKEAWQKPRNRRGK